MAFHEFSSAGPVTLAQRSENNIGREMRRASLHFSSEGISLTPRLRHMTLFPIGNQPSFFVLCQIGG